ncbi:hypothetical protein J0H58_36240 [bacterium]|nr:hypothetical protein [bacterium]
MAPQLVGQRCTHCDERISSDLDGRYCRTCGCPAHTECARDAAPAADACTACRTPAAVLRDREAQRQAVLARLPADRPPPRPSKAVAPWPGGACPRCRLVNPPAAQRCDCGYDFLTQTVEQSYLTRLASAGPDAGSRVAGYGCLLLTPFLLLSGVLSAVKAVGAGGDSAGALGYACGSILPGVGALCLAAYLLRPGPRGRG